MKKLIMIGICSLFFTNPVLATATDYDQTCLQNLESGKDIVIADSVSFSPEKITLIFPPAELVEINRSTISASDNKMLEAELEKGFAPIFAWEMIFSKKTLTATVPVQWNASGETISCGTLVISAP